MRVADDRDFRPRKRTHRMLADKARVTRVVRMDGHRGVAHQRLGSRRGNFQIRPRLFRHLVAHYVELALGGLHDDFLVAQRRLRHRTPIDHALAAVNQPLRVKFDEYLLHLPRVILIHGKSLAVPIAGAAEAFELLDNDAAVFFLPRPHALQKFLPSQIAARFALFLAQLPLDHSLCGDAGMVRAWQPQHLVARLPRTARQDVLQRVVQHMAEREHTGDVRRWNDNGKPGLGGGGVGRKATFLDPLPIPPLFHGTGFISFGNFGHRTGHDSEAGAFCKPLSRLRSPGRRGPRGRNGENFAPEPRKGPPDRPAARLHKPRWTQHRGAA